MSFPSDLEIARSVTPRPIVDIAARARASRDDELELYGPTKAKVTLEAIERLEAERPRGKYVVVTAITPTPLGEGKSTTTVGLAQGLNQIGQQGGGQHPPAVARAGVRDQGRRGRRRLQPGHPDGGLQPPPDRRRPRDRGGAQPGRRRSSTTASTTRTRSGSTRTGSSGRASSTSATARCATSSSASAAARTASRARPSSSSPSRPRSWPSSPWPRTCSTCGRGSAGSSWRRARDGTPVTAEDLGVAGAMTVLLRDAIKPNLLQTLEGGPAFVHCGPFANIAHGNNSIIADRLALVTNDIVCTEAGFGADMGAEKFFDIKCRASGLDAGCGRRGRHHPGAQDARRRGQDRRRQAARPGAARGERRGGARTGARTSPSRSRTCARFGVPAVVAINSSRPTRRPRSRRSARSRWRPAPATRSSPRTSPTAAPAPRPRRGRLGCDRGSDARTSSCSTRTRRRSARRSRPSSADLRRRRDRAHAGRQASSSSSTRTWASATCRCAWPRPSTRSATTPRSRAGRPASPCRSARSACRRAPASSRRSAARCGRCRACRRKPGGENIDIDADGQRRRAVLGPPGGPVGVRTEYEDGAEQQAGEADRARSR